MQLITAPGVYQNFPEDDYHADPCPEPSLSRGIAKTIVQRTPRHAFIKHPRLDPAYEKPEENNKFNMGNAGHMAILGRGTRFVEGAFDNWVSGPAKKFRAEAHELGLTPLLSEQFARVHKMREAVFEQLPEHGLGHLFNPAKGRAEVVMAAVDPVAGWSRIMVDWLEEDLSMWDLKITEVDTEEDSIGRHCSGMGYEWQHGFYEHVETLLYPELEGRVKFNLLFVEAKAPFQILPVTLPRDALAKGRAGVDKARRIWAECRKAGVWPRHKRLGVQTLEYPPWSIAEFVNVEEA